MPENGDPAIALKAPKISREIFGGILDYDGMGFYPGVELLNFVFCTEGKVLLPSDDPIRLKRQSHDFARRLVWDEGFDAFSGKNDVLYNEETEHAIRDLMECLQLEIPNLRKKPTWERAHFFPYTRSLIHWDARLRGSRIKFERRYLRGGGAFAFHVLRKDRDANRLNRCREGFGKLFSSDAQSSLEKLTSVLADVGVVDDSPKKDDVEGTSSVHNDGQEDLYRNGVVRILEHKQSSVTRIKAIINWTTFWLINLQHCRAAKHLERPISKIICDCGTGNKQLRRASRRCLKDMQSLIVESVDKAVKEHSATMSRQQISKIRSFFWASAASIKMLNAWTGRRHFTLGLNILETLVLASADLKGELPFEKFVDDWLFEKYNIVAGRKAAEKYGLLSVFDASIFEDNENKLATHMAAAGLLTQYSDATRMVSVGGM